MKILFLVIAYNNEDEVVSFLRQLDRLDKISEHTIEVVVTDNFGNFPPTASETVDLHCTVLNPGANLGYLKGCAHGLTHYLQKNSTPTWVSISNTDLELPDDYLNIVNEVPADVGQLSPAVTKSNGINQNPHIMSRPGNSYYLKQKLIHFNSIFGALYIWLSGKSRTKSNKIGKISVQSEHSDLSIFCSHGSIFFLHKRFFEAGGSLAHGPFLYGEELYIGEQLRRFKLGSLCRPHYKVTHNAHGTSRFVSLRNKSKLFKSSFALLHKHSKMADI